MSDRSRARDTCTRYRSATANGVRNEEIGVREEPASAEESEPLLLRIWISAVRCALTASVWLSASVIWLLAFGLWGGAGSLLGWLLIPPVMGWLDGRGSDWQDAVLATIPLWPAFVLYTFTLTWAIDAGVFWLVAVLTFAAVVHRSLRIRYE